jgi:hypothetical protein
MGRRRNALLPNEGKNIVGYTIELFTVRPKRLERNMTASDL